MARLDDFGPVASHRPAAGPLDWISETIGALWMWQFRAHTRHRLSQLDQHLLNDIGIDAAMRDRETAKPFWRA